jgi:hypothetical protein
MGQGESKNSSNLGAYGNQYGDYAARGDQRNGSSIMSKFGMFGFGSTNS